MDASLTTRSADFKIEMSERQPTYMFVFHTVVQRLSCPTCRLPCGLDLPFLIVKQVCDHSDFSISVGGRVCAVFTIKVALGFIIVLSMFTTSWFLYLWWVLFLVIAVCGSSVFIAIFYPFVNYIWWTFELGQELRIIEWVVCCSGLARNWKWWALILGISRIGRRWKCITQRWRGCW